MSVNSLMLPKINRGSCRYNMNDYEEVKKMNLRRFWSGRTDQNPSSTRFHEEVILDDKKEIKENDFAILGFESDEGVQRNQGNPGAALAPNRVRQFLANLPFHLNEQSVFDQGNITCTNGALEKAQEQLADKVVPLLEKGSIPIIIGGGHETFYGHFLGVNQFREDQSLGIINIDAHFDLRLDETPSSGTMFRQALEENEQINYLCLGIQRLGNTKVLFDTAATFNVEYLFEDEMDHLEDVYSIIDNFVKKHDYIILTLCMDALSSSVAPGVSAPSPFGLEAKQVRALLRYIAQKEQTISFDLSEVNPLLDEQNKTARLAALFIADFMLHKA